MKEKKYMKEKKFKIITKEVEVLKEVEFENENGEIEKRIEQVVEEKEFIEETPEPIHILKEDKIAQIKSRLAIYQAEVVRNQEMVDGLQAELESLK